MFDAWATGIFTISGTLLGTYFGYLLTQKMEKSKEKKESQILLRKIKRSLDNIAEDFDSISSDIDRFKEINTKRALDSINNSLRTSNFLNEVCEFEKLSSQLLYYKDNTSIFDLLTRNLSFYARYLSYSLDNWLNDDRITSSGQFTSDLKPLFRLTMDNFGKNLESLQKEFEKLK